MAAEARRSNTALAVSLPLALAVLGGGLWYLNREPGAAAKPALTADAKTYVRSLKLSEVEMKATENFAGQQVVEIVGKISNAGDRAVSLVEVNCVFYDAYGQVVLRERVAIVRQSSGGLKPGDTKSFRLPFDNLSTSWNQAMPQLVIAQIQFG